MFCEGFQQSFSLTHIFSAHSNRDLVSIAPYLFKQGASTPNIGLQVTNIMQGAFEGNRINCRSFPTLWSARFPYLNSRDFWFSEYLKNILYSGSITKSADPKETMCTRSTIPRQILFVLMRNIWFYILNWWLNMVATY